MRRLSLSGLGLAGVSLAAGAIQPGSPRLPRGIGHPAVALPIIQSGGNRPNQAVTATDHE